MATFGRLKVWVRERLKFSDLNGEFNNILNGMTPSGVEGASSDVTAMRATADPAPGGTESLATSLLGELQRLRFALQQAVGGTYWYSTPGASLTANAKSLFAYLPSEGLTTTEALVDYLQRGGLLNALTTSAADIAISDFDLTNKKFGGAAMKVTTTSVWATPGAAAQSLSLGCHFRNLAAGDYIAYNPLLGIELFLDGSGFLTARVAKQGAASETAKTLVTVAGAVSRAGNTSWQHAALRNRVNAVGGATTDLLHLLRNAADEGTQQNAISIPIGVGDGGFWFLGARPNTPSWDKYSAMLVTPDTEASSAWSAAVSGTGSAAVSGGVLTMTAPTGSTSNYTRATGINMAQQTIETKFRVRSVNGETIPHTVFGIEDASLSRALLVQAFNGQLIVVPDAMREFRIPINCKDWVSVRATLLGAVNPVLNLYINGVHVLKDITLDQSFVLTASDELYFGLANSGSETLVMDVESFAYVSSVATTVYPPIAAAPSATGQLDDFVASGEVFTNAIVTALSSFAASQVYKADFKRGLQLPFGAGFGALNGGSESQMNDFKVSLVSDGRTPLSALVAGHYANSLQPSGIDNFAVALQRGTSPIVLDQWLNTNYFDPPANGVYFPVSLNAQRTLPLGVHNLRMHHAFNNGGVITAEFNLALAAGQGGR